MFNEEYQSPSHILLTGGTGFFGRALLRHWISQIENGVRVAKVCVLSRDPEKFLKEYPEFSKQWWLQFHQGDILLTDTLPVNVSFTHILHAATDSTIGPSLKPLERFNQIYEGTRNMLNYAVVNGINRFMLTSSGGVYGQQPLDIEAITEDYNGMPDPLIAQNAYSVAKRTAEHLCALYKNQYGIEIVIARCFSFVGQDLPLKVHFAIGNFIDEALNRSAIHINGDGTPIRTYLDQRDLAHWLCEILYRGRNGEAYNVGSETPITIKELAELVRDTLAPDKAVIVKSEQNTINVRNRYIPNVNKAQSQLNLKNNFTIKESILNIIKKVV
jgi:UDP-glucuronate decarboxylase